jgi:hypothetical protein
VRKTEIDKLPAEVDPILAWTFDAEHEKQHAQWAWNTNQESLAWCLDGLISEVERLTIDNRRLTEMWDADRETLTVEIERLRIELHRVAESMDGDHWRLMADLAGWSENSIDNTIEHSVVFGYGK